MMAYKAMMVAVLAAAIPQVAGAQELITNGDFETGTYSGWTPNVQEGSSGNLFIVANDGGSTPLSGASYATNATGGAFFSITDQSEPGSYALTQGFTVATAGPVTVSFDMFVNNYANNGVFPGRDYTVGSVQNAMVEILFGAADPFSDSASDIAWSLYGPGAETTTDLPNPWASYSFTRNLAAGSYLIRFAETDNQGFFNHGVDNVSVFATVPEPSTWALTILGFGCTGAALRRRSFTPRATRARPRSYSRG